ncbi:hypothetical protein [Staphylococcus simulans]|uniref:hypothetical protein n=1 Tax=Staphylococcus simulans TaxID=1286 RepID=UPI002DB966CA|nr:hypothetical protein [Staphylococcus simulans]MEB6837989.1 hypothetical protein [Staphylococcus simulans]
MKNTKTYENIKIELVDVILKAYSEYKDQISEFEQQIDRGMAQYIFNLNKPISMNASARRSVMHLDKKLNDKEQFDWEMGNLSERYEYITRYRKTFNKVVHSREALIDSVNELKVFNKITKRKFSEKKDATAIFEPIKTFKVNKLLRQRFENIEDIKRSVDSYVSNGFKLSLRKITTKENGLYKIDNEKLERWEKEFFDHAEEAVRYDLKKIEMIEEKKEVDNYLKYYLLFK